VIRETDVGGAALEPLDNPTDPPPAIVDKATVYAKILALLDEAQAHLQAAGTSFAFSMPSGFSSFNKPATFLLFNRGLRAKVNVTSVQYAAALTDLAGSFLDPTKPMSLGVYHTYTTLAGDRQNALYDPTARQRYHMGRSLPTRSSRPMGLPRTTGSPPRSTRSRPSTGLASTWPGPSNGTTPTSRPCQR
jgi:hypothetical protein